MQSTLRTTVRLCSTRFKISSSLGGDTLRFFHPSMTVPNMAPKMWLQMDWGNIQEKEDDIAGQGLQDRSPQLSRALGRSEDSR